MLCLLQFYDEWSDFRLPELKALLAMHNLTWDDIVRPDTANPTVEGEERHFYIIDVPNEEVVRAICSRAILVKAVYELWSSGCDLDSAVRATQGLESDFLGPYLQSESSWCININTFGRTYTMEQKQDCRLHFKFLDFKGPVDVVTPQMELCVTLDYSKFRHVTPSTVTNPEDGGLVRLVRTDVPVYFGRLLARGGMKETLKVHDLKKRLYLGPTSLDDSLALILANISGVQRGMLAYDPFVGTASILVALTQLGAVCTGSDIDPRVLRGEMHAGTTSGDEGEGQSRAVASTNALPTPPASADGQKKHIGVAEATAKKGKSKHNAQKRNIFANFKSYGLPLPELIRMDNHLFDRHIALKYTQAPASEHGRYALNLPNMVPDAALHPAHSLVFCIRFVVLLYLL
jgi:tRNA (guanine10-N2)-methyltransferase